MKPSHLIILILLFAALAPTSMLNAANSNDMPFVKTPQQALHEVFGPIKNSFGTALKIVQNIILGAYNIIKEIVLWGWDKLTPIFNWIEDWFKETTGLTISETLDTIGKFFVNIVDIAEKFISSLWSSTSKN